MPASGLETRNRKPGMCSGRQVPAGEPRLWAAPPGGLRAEPGGQAPQSGQDVGAPRGPGTAGACAAPPRAAEAAGRDTSGRHYQLPIARKHVLVLASCEELARHEAELLQVGLGPVHARLRPVHAHLRPPHSRARAPAAVRREGQPGTARGSPGARPPPRPARCPLRPPVCSPARRSAWTWSGGPPSAPGTRPPRRSCRWPCAAACSCWTCSRSRGRRTARRPGPSRGCCRGCSQTRPSPSWVRAACRARPSPGREGSPCSGPHPLRPLRPPAGYGLAGDLKSLAASCPALAPALQQLQGGLDLLPVHQRVSAWGRAG